MDLDFSGLWTWTVPLWGLFILVLFLVGILSAPVILEGIGPAITAVTSAPAVTAAATGVAAATAAAAAPAALPKKSVSFASNVKGGP